MLIASGSSHGGARPKSSIEDDKGHLCPAKFPGRQDDFDVAAWEKFVHSLAYEAGIRVPEAAVMLLSEGHRRFLVKRFDSSNDDKRLCDKEIRSVFACPERGPAGTESGVSCLLIARQRNE
jgi:serine/threonine-protein kinase HipA